MGVKTARPNRELAVAVDFEGGVILARDAKRARLVGSTPAALGSGAMCG